MRKIASKLFGSFNPARGVPQGTKANRDSLGLSTASYHVWSKDMKKIKTAVSAIVAVIATLIVAGSVGEFARMIPVGAVLAQANIVLKIGGWAGVVLVVIASVFSFTFKVHDWFNGFFFSGSGYYSEELIEMVIESDGVGMIRRSNSKSRSRVLDFKKKDKAA